MSMRVSYVCMYLHNYVCNVTVNNSVDWMIIINDLGMMFRPAVVICVKALSRTSYGVMSCQSSVRAVSVTARLASCQ